MNQQLSVRQAGATPRLGFLGVGWIGRHRMEALARSGAAHVAAVADASPEARATASAATAGAAVSDSIDALLLEDLDGIVIATPSAQHAEQAEAALRCNLAVFCQKPLARTAAETRRVVEAARAADKLLGVDFSYRYTAAMQRVREVVVSGDIGDVYAAELVFHNAYGPDKPWFYDRALSGGGCVIDLGIHLVDLSLWVLAGSHVRNVDARLFAAGSRWRAGSDAVEDYADVRLDLDSGASVRLACSWRLHAGQDAVISAAFYGPRGGVAVRNVNGSFYDFVAERLSGTSRTMLASAPDDWGGRAAEVWARQLARDARFDPAIERVVHVAEVIDAIYER